ncbi:AraC family transcriptional regulator [Methylomonas koyamae]|uniref:AraC family transcriptional regulator n=1 Tax=Methylomonas koyamae TaxID=702114 RepID=UPI001C3420A6|nr:helix-turn-helix domain-containing protein [Methylomonas koyamae]BBL60630.1 hypothetical protein MKFW12EY_42430 [Methylomonas koyamae]
MQIAALLSIGFSFGAALLLVAGNLLQSREPLIWPSRCAGFVLIAGLAAIQTGHLAWLTLAYDALHSAGYRLALYLVAPGFYFFSRHLLTADVRYRWRDLLHAAPLPLCGVLPQTLAIPGAFLLGSAYLIWLAHAVYRLRAQRQRFRLELVALGTLFAIAVAVLLLGFVWPLLAEADFIQAYSLLIGLAFFAVALTLLRFPAITADVAEAAQASYAESTLKNVDKPKKLAELERLMRQDKLYRLDTLNLALLAEQLALSQHQLSELINTEFRQGFSRYIREQRIEDAKKLLVTEPEASVLSIGLTVGFSTQSNFYAAFREIVGIAPGQYRKLHATPPS